MRAKDPVHKLLKITLESDGQVAVSTGVPELHMFVCPPCNAFLYQRNKISGAIWVNVVQLQSVWNKHSVQVRAANKLTSEHSGAVSLDSKTCNHEQQ